MEVGTDNGMAMGVVIDVIIDHWVCNARVRLDRPPEEIEEIITVPVGARENIRVHVQSCGVVLIRLREGCSLKPGAAGWEGLVLEKPAEESDDLGGERDLPKGHILPGESERDRALAVGSMTPHACMCNARVYCLCVCVCV